jgi:hypothetical protein
MNDNVNHPPHYTNSPSGIECVEIAERLSFNLGNALKYIWRAGKKNPETLREDLQKALWYVNRERATLANTAEHVIVQPGNANLVRFLAMKVVATEPGQDTLLAQVFNVIMAATGGYGDTVASPENALNRIADLLSDLVRKIPAAANVNGSVERDPELPECYICRSLKDMPGTTAVCAHHASPEKKGAL